MDTAGSQWYPATFKTLHGLLCDAFGHPKHSVTDAAGEEAMLVVARRLQAELQTHRVALIAVGHDSRPSRDHRNRIVNQKTAEINGMPYELTADFVNETTKLADFLNIDEDLAATLLQFATEFATRFGRSPAETAILLYHTEAYYKIAALELIVKAAMDEEIADPIHHLCQWFLNEHILVGSATVAAASTSTTSVLVPWLKVLVSHGSRIGHLQELKSRAQSLPHAASALSASETVESLLPFGSLVVDEMVEKLTLERQTLANVLFLACYYRTASPGDVTALCHHVKDHGQPHDPVTLYLIASILASIDLPAAAGPNPERSDTAAAFASTAHVAAITQISDLLNSVNHWPINSVFFRGLRGLILLQWSQFLLLILHRYPAFESQVGFREDRIEQWVEHAVQLGAFPFITHYCLSFKAIDDSRYETPDAHVYPPTARATDPDFQWHMCYQLCQTITGLIANMSSILRRMRYREEDSFLHMHHQQAQRLSHDSSVFDSRSTGDGGIFARPSEPVLQHDIEQLFTVVATLYADRQDMGLQFWVALSPSHLPLTEQPLAYKGVNARLDTLDERLHVFLKWASDCRVPGMIRAYFDMLGSLATGPQCAQFAYMFMSTGSASATASSAGGLSRSLCSWSALFAALEFYAQRLRQAAATNPASGTQALSGLVGENAISSLANSAAVAIPPAEVDLILSFLRLLRQVVSYSVVVRITLYENAQYRALYTLFNLLGCRIPITLKAAILSTIAAFCAPPAVAVRDHELDMVPATVEIAKQVWHFLEMSQTVPTVHDVAILQRHYQHQQQQPPTTQVSSFLASSPTRTPNIHLMSGVIPPSAMRPLAEGQSAGMLFELEEIESMKEIYPETLAFVHFLLALIHPPLNTKATGANVPRLTDGSDPLPVSNGYGTASPSVPTDLGGAYRLPGIAPYVTLVVDNVLLKADQRGYRYSAEKWQVVSACLQLVERCLQTFDLTHFLLNPDVRAFSEHHAFDPAQFTKSLSQTQAGAQALPPQLASTLRSLLLHPGFDLLVRILTGTKLCDTLLDILQTNSVDVLNSSSGTPDSAESEPPSDASMSRTEALLLAEVTRRVLRILAHVLQVQSVFLSQLYPLLADPWVQDQLQINPLHLPRSITSLDQLLLYRYPAIVQMALLINCQTSPEVCLLSIHLLGQLAASPVFCGTAHPLADVSHPALLPDLPGDGVNRLVTLLENSDESLRILYGYLERLEHDEPELNDASVPESSNDPLCWAAGAGKDSAPSRSPINANAIRLAIIDLILANLDPHRGCPSLAHWLLGFDVSSPQAVRSTQIRDPQLVAIAVDAQRTPTRMSCLHIVLEALRQGTSASQGMAADGVTDSDAEPGLGLFSQHPVFAEHCYHLMYRLCADANTGPPVRKYLREIEDFYPKQLGMMVHSSAVFLEPSAVKGDPHEVTMNPDWVNITRSVAFLHQRAWLFRGSALELHQLATNQLRAKALALLRVLYQPADESSEYGLAAPTVADVDEHNVAFWELTISAQLTSKFGPLGIPAHTAPLTRWFVELHSLWRETSLFFQQAYVTLDAASDSSDAAAAPVASRSKPHGDGGTPSPSLEYFQQVNFQAFTRTDGQGCTTYDLRALYLQLQVELRRKEQEGIISSVGHRHKAQQEVRHILRFLFVKSQQLKVEHAHNHALHAWQQLVEVTFTSGFDYLRIFASGGGESGGWSTGDDLFSLPLASADATQYRSLEGQSCEPLILQLLDVTLTRFGLPGHRTDETMSSGLIHLGNLVLLLVAKLGYDLPQRLGVMTSVWLQTHHQTAAGSVSSMALLESQFPVPWLAALWERLIPSVVDTGSVLALRGTLYTAVLYFLRYVFTVVDKDAEITERLRDGPSSTGAVGQSGALTQQQAPSRTRGQLEKAVVAVLQTYGDQLLEMLGRDAIDGAGVWRTVAFALLEQLVRCFGRSGAGNKIVQFIAHRNLLHHMVTVLKRDELGLAQTLQLEPQDLVPLFVFESKMSFFLRLAQSRDGIDRLQDNGVVDVLDDCQVLELRPEGDTTQLLQDDAQQPTFERYHHILLPIIQLLHALMAKPARERAVLATKAAQYLTHHRRVFEAVFTDDSKFVSLLVLKEMTALTALLNLLVRCMPLAPRTSGPFSRGGSPLDLFGFETAVLAVLTRYREYREWQPRLKAVGDQEQALAETMASMGDGQMSLLELQATDAVQCLFRNILEACLFLTGSGGLLALREGHGLLQTNGLHRDFQPKFASTVAFHDASSAADGENAPTFGLRAPSLATLVMVLAHSVKALQGWLRQRDQLVEYNQAPSHLTTSEVAAILQSSPLNDQVDSLSLSQRQQVAQDALHQQLKAMTVRIHTTLQTVEVALYLLWQHLEYYLSLRTSPHTVSPVISRTRDGTHLVAHAFQQLTRPSSDQQATLRLEAASLLQPVMAQLNSLQLPTTITDVDADRRSLFIQRTTRKLKDILQGSLAVM
ncbi:hypothetical protein H4R34_003950 [Dimargaris verticillata]|uniref:Uncharacterized protein n=1 Tax=Dimargaris verticillata TaxID=2761393 RepID=A0A9W8AZ36_9FUNG|nr:hypothetical protein H4R34_003950 [Dimargaris verticillata]